MELLQLKYFQKAAYLEHMTRAAEELCISQPSLSKTILSLEKELGVQLFERSGKYIRLNHNGKVFLKYVDIALSALENGRRELSNVDKSGVEYIYLAVLAASPLLPGLLSSFRDRYPNVDFRLLQHLPKFLSYDFDLCISCLPLNVDGIRSIPLMTEKIYLALPRSHPLSSKKSIRLDQVANEGFISLRRGSALREITDSYCRLAGFTPRVIFESDDPGTVRGLIKAGQGIGFIPAISWGGTTGSSVALVQIEEPVCQRTIGLSWAESRVPSDTVRLFSDFTLGYFRELVKALEV